MKPDTFIILFTCWIIFIPLSLSRVAEKISLLGIYHTIEKEGSIKAALNRYREREKEGLVSKIQKVFYTNISLSLPFLVAYYIVIDNTLESRDIGSYDVFCLTFIITLVSLLSIRVLANLPQTVDIGIYKLYPKEERVNVRKVHQERIISFFHSFVCASLFVLGIILSSNVISNTALLQNDLQNLKSSETVVLACVYFGALLMFTAAIELFYYNCPPWICIKQSEDDASSQANNELLKVQSDYKLQT